MTEPGANWMGMRLWALVLSTSSIMLYTKKPSSTIASATTSYQLKGSVSSPAAGAEGEVRNGRGRGRATMNWEDLCGYASAREWLQARHTFRTSVEIEYRERAAYP